MAARNTDLARHGLVLFLALAVANLSNYVFHLFMSRLLGPSAYGALGALLSIFTIVSVPAGALQIAVAKKISIFRVRGEKSLTAQLLRSVSKACLFVGSGLLLITYLARLLLADFLHLSSALPVMLLGLYAIPALIAPVLRGGLQGDLRFRALALIAVASTLLRLIAGIILVWLGYGVTGAVAASVAAEFIAVAISVVLLRTFMFQRPERIKIPGVFKEARLAILAFGGFWAFATVDTVLVRHLFSERTSGIYTAAAVLARAILFLPGAVAVVAFPKFAESGGKSVEARRTLFHSLIAVGVLSFFSSILLVAFRTPLLKLLFGEEYVSGAAVIAILAGAMTLLGLTNILIYFHIASSSKAIWSLIPALLAEGIGIWMFQGSLTGVALSILVVSTLLTFFNLVAAYAYPGDPKVQPFQSKDLWDPGSINFDLTVVTPAFNPGPAFKDNLHRLREVLSESNISYEIIAVSDGSTDGSHQLFDDHDQAIRLVHYDVNRGKGFALRTGLAMAQGRYVAFIDSDGDLHPSELEPFLTLMKTYDLDLVVGSKRHPLSEVHYPPLRRVMSWTYHLLIRVLFRVKLSDTQTGLKLAKRELLVQVLPRILEKRFAFDLELIVVARLLGFRRILEAPVRLQHRFGSTVSWRTTMRTILDTLAIFYRRYILFYYHDDPADEATVHLGSQQELPIEVAEVH